MTQFIDSTTPDGGGSSSSTTDVAKDEARNVAQTAQQAGGQVVSTATDQAKQVTQETKKQAQDLLSQGRTQAGEQARNGQAQAASSLSNLAGELRSMLDHSDDTEQGPAHDLVRQATERVDSLADWLQSHEPGDLLTEVRSFAQRRPGAFLLGAAVAGIVAGRLTTGVVAAHKDEASSSTPPQSVGSYPQTYQTPQVPESTGYLTPAYPSVIEGAPAVPGEGYAPGTESNWADPQRTYDDGGRL